jgi:spore germination cell wall hydrolase CwlJ-like protein
MEKPVREKPGIKVRVDESIPAISVPIQEKTEEKAKPEKYEIKKEKKNYRTEDFSQDSDEVLLARMLFGEARGCDIEEKIAIAYTAINRAEDGKAWNGETLREVLLKPYQYSCFNKSDLNRKKLMDPEKYDVRAWQECLEVAKDILADRYKDPTNRVTHYFKPSVVKPSWADKITRIGRIKGSRHEFYREE